MICFYIGNAGTTIWVLFLHSHELWAPFELVAVDFLDLLTSTKWLILNFVKFSKRNMESKEDHDYNAMLKFRNLSEFRFIHFGKVKISTKSSKCG